MSDAGFIDYQYELIKFYKKNANQLHYNEWLFALLPNNIVLKIINYSKNTNTLQVCRRWNSIYWKYFLNSYSGCCETLTKSLTKSLMASCPFLIVINIHGIKYKMKKQNLCDKSDVFQRVLLNNNWNQSYMTDNYILPIKNLDDSFIDWYIDWIQYDILLSNNNYDGDLYILYQIADYFQSNTLMKLIQNRCTNILDKLQIDDIIKDANPFVACYQLNPNKCMQRFKELIDITSQDTYSRSSFKFPYVTDQQYFKKYHPIAYYESCINVEFIVAIRNLLLQMGCYHDAFNLVQFYCQNKTVYAESASFVLDSYFTIHDDVLLFNLNDPFIQKYVKQLKNHKDFNHFNEYTSSSYKYIIQNTQNTQNTQNSQNSQKLNDDIHIQSKLNIDTDTEIDTEIEMSCIWLDEFDCRFLNFTNGCFPDTTSDLWNSTILSGGSLYQMLDPLCDKLCISSDFDLFVYSLNDNYRTQVIKRWMEYFQKKFSNVIFSVRNSVISIFILGFKHTIQLINTNQSSILGILLNFDNTLSQCAYQSGQVYCTSKYLTTMLTRTCEIIQSPSIHRIAKISNRNFDIIYDDTNEKIKLPKCLINPIFDNDFLQNQYLVWRHPKTIQNRSHYYHPNTDESFEKIIYEIKLHYPKSSVSKQIKPILDRLKPWNPSLKQNYSDIDEDTSYSDTYSCETSDTSDDTTLLNDE
jgi:hypothetical protein